MAVTESFPISKTKIITPKRRPEIVTRSRLIETLYELLNKKLILISAPAGYGKTSLLIDLVAQSEIPICWLSLDQLDQEPQRFLLYFVACITERFPAFGKESFGALQNVSSLQNDTERLVVTLTNEMLLNIPEHFVLVLDDYHFIDSIPEIRNFINRLVQLAGENFHLILASRTLPFLPDLHLLAARNEVGGISFEDLAFLPEEIQAFFRQNSKQAISLDDANRMAEQTEGWVTSLTLSNLSHLGVETKKGAPDIRTGVEVFDYFAREILEKQPADIREFLLLTSLFDEVETELCNTVLASQLKEHARDWKSLFQAVQKSSLFVIPLGTNGKLFRYHHLFQDFLKTELRAKDPNLEHEVLSRLAHYYREKQDWEKAHFIYETIGDQNALIKLIDQVGTNFIRNGRIVTLANWLDRVPVSLLRQNPALLSIQGAVASIQGKTQLGLSLLSEAEATFRATHDIENLISTLVRRAFVYRDLGEYSLSLVDADEVIVLTEKNFANSLRDTFAVAQREKGLALYRLGRTKEAISWLQNSLHLFGLLKEKNAVSILEMELGMAYQSLGNTDLAIKFYDNALKAWEATGNVGWQATLKNNLGVLHHVQGDFVQAFITLEGALDCARRSGYVRAEALALCSLGDLLADLEDLGHSDECFTQALNIASQLKDSYLESYASISKARIARLNGDFSLAEKLLMDFLPHIQNHISSSEDALFRQEYGCFLLFSGKPGKSLDEFKQAIALYKQDGRSIEECVSRLWLACGLIANQPGGEDAALSQLEDLSKLGRNLENPVFLYVHMVQARLWIEKIDYAQYLQDDAKTFVQLLITKSERFSKSIPTLRRKLRHASHIVSISPPHLKIRALGPAQVVCGEKIMTMSDWQRREPKDLLFFFLQSEALTKEEIADVFWPDISPARLKIRFRDNVYRLRQAVGVDTVLFDGERYKFNRDIDYDYDVQTFDELLKHAHDSKATADTITILQEAVDLVKGPYLSDIDGEWVSAERMRIETEYINATIELARLYLDTGQVNNTLTICRNVLEIDPLLEDAYRLSMLAYAAIGDRTAIIRQFQTCNDILLSELGVSASKETELLYKKLI